MDYARSLSGGGQLFYAKEFGRQYGWGLNPLMLRCAFCGEPVLFKHGSEKNLILHTFLTYLLGALRRASCDSKLLIVAPARAFSIL